MKSKTLQLNSAKYLGLSESLSHQPAQYQYFNLKTLLPN